MANNERLEDLARQIGLPPSAEEAEEFLERYLPEFDEETHYVISEWVGLEGTRGKTFAQIGGERNLSGAEVKALKAAAVKQLRLLKEEDKKKRERKK